jgi:hypothetical protein
MITLPGADTMKAGIIGLDFLRSIFLRVFSLRLPVPLVMPLTLASVPVGLEPSESDPLWAPICPLRVFVARCVVIGLLTRVCLYRQRPRDGSVEDNMKRLGPQWPPLCGRGTKAPAGYVVQLVSDCDTVANKLEATGAKWCEEDTRDTAQCGEGENN